MMRKWEIAPIAVVGLLVAGIVGFFYHGVLEYHYFIHAPYLYDTALFNYILGPDSHGLAEPQAIDFRNFGFAHVSPILLPFSTLSRLLGLDEGQPLEVVLLLGLAGGAVTAFAAFLVYLRPLGLWPALGLSALAALAFGFCGIANATANFPHIEALYPPLAIAALLLMFQRRMRWAWLAFALCLGVREDAGLHLACILGAYLFLAAIAEGRAPERARDLLPFLAVALAYPLVAMGWQHAVFNQPSGFVRVYIGSPPFAHVTWPLLAHRLHLLGHAHVEGTLALFATLAPFLVRPRWVALCGFLAVLPWTVVSVLAVADPPGILTLYYAFPFLAAVAAPFIVTAPLPSAKREYVAYDL